MGADHSQKSIRHIELPLDDHAKVVAALNRVEIHERIFPAELGAKNVEQPPGIGGTVFAAITNEHSRHGRMACLGRIVELYLGVAKNKSQFFPLGRGVCPGWPNAKANPSAG